MTDRPDTSAIVADTDDSEQAFRPFTDDEPIYDVILRALMEQYRHPDRHGGGMIGKATAVTIALGINGDAPVRTIR